MKNIFLSILLFTFSISFAQQKKEFEKIGKIGAYGMGLVYCEKEINTYTFTYEDQNEMRVNDYVSFSFEGKDIFEQLYDTIMVNLEIIPKGDIYITSQENYVRIDFAKFLGIKSFRFKQSKKKNGLGFSFSTWMTKKETKKLFGK